jgi:xylan 1,4-beta-xylosidase
VDAALSDGAGLVVFMDETHHYELCVVAGRLVVQARIGPVESVMADVAAPPGPVELVIETCDDRTFRGPDEVMLGLRLKDGSVYELSLIDGRYLTTEVTGGFVGRMVGLFSIQGPAYFKWFDYRASP